MGYVDYKKAFDSMPHSYLREILAIYKVHPFELHFLIALLERAMIGWNTILHLFSHNNSIITSSISIQRGIIQGDSISPLWFCLGLNPLSRQLNSSGVGFKLKIDNAEHLINNLLYVGDLKLYASSSQGLTQLLTSYKKL